MKTAAVQSIRQIKLEGMVTVNGYFKVGLDGSIEATNGKFTGDISASNITGSAITGTTITGGTITGSHLYGTYIGTTEDNFFVLDDGDDVSIGLGDGFAYENKKLFTSWIGSIGNPALSDDDTAGINGNTGKAGFREVYILDSWFEGGTGPVESGSHLWGVTETLRWLDGRVTSLENQCWTDCGGDGSDEESCPGDACMCENECDDLSCPCYTVD